MVTLDFNIQQKVVTVLAPDTEVDIQELYDKIKDFEDEPVMMSYPIICTATGKQPLTSAVKVAITLQMENGWKLAFEARPGPSYTLCSITGGNVVDSSEVIGAWLSPTAYVTVFGGASSSATLIQGSGGLTQQQVRDAMKLTPSAGAANTNSIDEKLNTLLVDLDEVKQVETGTWKIVGTQMIFYKQDGTTEIFRRDLKDSAGSPSNENVFEGIRV